MKGPLQVFCCYAREDQQLLLLLKKHLKPLEHRGLITPLQTDIDVRPGEEWEKKISHNLNMAQIILLLISSDFMDSEYCYGIEMKRALERQEQGEALVIPIILRQTDWLVKPLDKLQALPKNAEPVTGKFWYTLDEAFFDVTKGIQKAAEDLLSQSSAKIPTIEQTRVLLERTPDISVTPDAITKQSDEKPAQTFSEKYTRELSEGFAENIQPSPLFQETRLVRYVEADKSEVLPALAPLERIESSIQSTNSQRAIPIVISSTPPTNVWTRIRQLSIKTWLFIILAALILFTLITGSLVFAQQWVAHSYTGHTGAVTQIPTSLPGGNSYQKFGGKVSPTVPSKHTPTLGSTATVGSQPDANSQSTATARSSPIAAPGISPTPVPPTLTTVPSSFLVANTSKYCTVDTHGGVATDMTCNVTLNNTSRTSSKLNWSASMSPSDYTISPASGSIAPGNSITISFGTTTGVPCPASETLFIKGSANTVQIPIVCSYLLNSVSDNTLDSSNCTKNVDWTCPITLSTTRDTMSVPWQVTADSLTGVTLSQTSGTLAPDTSVQITITIASADCPGSDTFYFSGGSLANPANQLSWSC